MEKTTRNIAATWIAALIVAFALAFGGLVPSPALAADTLQAGSACKTQAVKAQASKAKISKAKVALAKKSYAYTGKAIKPVVTVKYAKKTLKRGRDFTVSYKNNAKAGTATVTVKGKGKYTGTKSAKFKIARASVAKATASVKSASYAYTGKTIKPAVTVKYAKKTLKRGRDFTVSYKNNVNVGTATISVKGKGNFAGAKTVKFKIVKKAASPTTATSPAAPSDAKAGTTGNANATVKNGSGTAERAGGTASSTSTPAKKSLTSATIAAIPQQKYTASEVRPSPTVKLDGKQLAANTDYTVSYKNNVRAGTATVTVTGKGAYSGSKSATFEIYSKDGKRWAATTQAVREPVIEYKNIVSINTDHCFFFGHGGDRTTLYYPMELTTLDRYYLVDAGTDDTGNDWTLSTNKAFDLTTLKHIVMPAAVNRTIDWDNLLALCGGSANYNVQTIVNRSSGYLTDEEREEWYRTLLEIIDEIKWINDKTIADGARVIGNYGTAKVFVITEWKTTIKTVEDWV